MSDHRRTGLARPPRRDRRFDLRQRRDGVRQHHRGAVRGRCRSAGAGDRRAALDARSAAASPTSGPYCPSCPIAAAHSIADFLGARAAGTTPVLGADQVVADFGDGTAALRPAVHLLAAPDPAKLNTELAFPCVWVSPWSRGDGLEPLRRLPGGQRHHRRRAPDRRTRRRPDRRQRLQRPVPHLAHRTRHSARRISGRLPDAQQGLHPQLTGGYPQRRIHPQPARARPALRRLGCRRPRGQWRCHRRAGTCRPSQQMKWKEPPCSRHPFTIVGNIVTDPIAPPGRRPGDGQVPGRQQLTAPHRRRNMGAGQLVVRHGQLLGASWSPAPAPPSSRATR